MAGDAAETRKRLLIAATEEFAARGIAGARVDRIAAEAGANKSLIYSYFTSKDGLFAAVYDAQVALTIDAVPFDATDLPGYAGRLFDHYQQNATVYRLTAWARLEQPSGDKVDAATATAVASNMHKIAAIKAEQAAGRLTGAFPPEALLTLVLSLANAFNRTAPEYSVAATIPVATQRDSIVEAVRLLALPRP